MSLANNTLIVLEKMDKKIALAVKNLPQVEAISANSLNIYELLNYKNILFAEEALKAVETTFLNERK